MIQVIPAVIVALSVGIALVYLTVRLRLLDRTSPPGRLLLFSGGVLMLAAAIWHIVRSSGGYTTWFVDDAYPFLEYGFAVVVILGLTLVVSGIFQFGRHWQDRLSEVDAQQTRLSLLAELQNRARDPYHLMELLDIGIKEIVTSVSDCSGAIFLINRPRQQLILGSSVGLSREEIACLEHYPLGQNTLSQALDLNEPLLSGEFELYDPDGRRVASRFQSTMILPLVSGMDTVGGIILMATDHQRFTGRDIRLLMPVSDWLAEKVKSARLSRQLTQTRSEKDKLAGVKEAVFNRLGSVLASVFDGDALTVACRKLVGVAGSRSVHIYSMADGTIVFHAGSEPSPDLTENYKAALIEALDKGRPLIVNQEGKADDRKVIIRSSLVVPVGETSGTVALLFVRDASPFTLTADDLEVLQMYGRLISIVWRQQGYVRMDIARRKGFENVISLLQYSKLPAAATEPAYLARHLGEVLPSKSLAITFVRDDDSFRSAHVFGSIDVTRPDLRLQPAEGFASRVLGSGQAYSVSGRFAVTRELEQLSSENRKELANIFGELGAPNLLTVCPAFHEGKIIALTAFFLADISESEAAEWRRMLTLAGELYSLSTRVAELTSRKPDSVELVEPQAEVSAVLRNELNNHLSAILGYAELAFSKSERGNETSDRLDSIIAEAQKAADLVRDSLIAQEESAGPVAAEEDSSATTRVEPSEFLGGTVETILEKLHISDNLHMIAGQPREVSVEADADLPVAIHRGDAHEAIEGALIKMASLSEDDEILRVRLYESEGYQYIDVVRQKKNLPAVERIAGIGEFVPVSKLLESRPGEAYLNALRQTDCSVAFDRFSSLSNYVSFRLPRTKSTSAEAPESRSALKVLAIDDQQVILDLISAMCQSLGYAVVTANSGREGIEIAGRSSFDIVLTDLAMPGLSGLETAREIKRLQPKVPIILVTGWEGRVDSAQLAEHGIGDILYKPFRIEQLTDLIRTRTASRTV